MSESWNFFNPVSFFPRSKPGTFWGIRRETRCERVARVVVMENKRRFAGAGVLWEDQDSFSASETNSFTEQNNISGKLVKENHTNIRLSARHNVKETSYGWTCFCFLLSLILILGAGTEKSTHTCKYWHPRPRFQREEPIGLGYVVSWGTNKKVYQLSMLRVIKLEVLARIYFSR